MNRSTPVDVAAARAAAMRAACSSLTSGAKNGRNSAGVMYESTFLPMMFDASSTIVRPITGGTSAVTGKRMGSSSKATGSPSTGMNAAT